MRPGFAPLDQTLGDLLRQEHRRSQIQFQRALPSLAGNPLGASGRRDTGIVDQDVDVAEFGGGARNDPLKVSLDRDIGLYR